MGGVVIRPADKRTGGVSKSHLSLLREEEAAGKVCGEGGGVEQRLCLIPRAGNNTPQPPSPSASHPDAGSVPEERIRIPPYGIILRKHHAEPV